MIRRVVAGLGILVLGTALVLGAEIWLALRRNYLPTDDPLALDRTFGSKGAPVLSLVVLGDSTSAGVGAENASEAYPTLLAQRLAQDTERAVELTVLGTSGARVRDVSRQQAPMAVRLDPDVILVAIGANDVTHLTPLDEVRNEMKRILNVLDDTDATVVVAGAPDMRVDAWHQPLRWLAYLRGKQVTQAIEEVARARRVRVVELAEETGHFFADEPARHFSQDGFHPSALGYERWADAIFPVLRNALSESEGI